MSCVPILIRQCIFGCLLSLPLIAQGQSESGDLFQQLNDEIQWLQEEVYVTTATKTKETLKKSGSTISVFTANDLRAMGARTLYDALKRLPGIGISKSNVGTSAIEVRGVKTSFAEKVLFLINGHSVNNNLVNGGANSAFNEFIIDDIKHVEVVRGPGSALYGTNAFVAAINIITKQATDIDGVEVTVGAGSDDTKKGNIQFGHQFNDWSVAGNLHVSDTNGYDGFVASDSLGQQGHADDWQTRYEGSLNVQSGGFFGQARYLKREHGTFLGANNVLSNDSEQEYIDYFLEMGYRGSLMRQLGMTVKGYFDHFEFDNTWNLLPQEMGVYPDDLIVRSPIKHDIFGVETQFDYQLGARHKVLLGAQYEHQSQYDVAFWSNGGSGALVDISDTANWNDSHNRDITAVYLQDIWDATDTLRFILGGRYDHYSDFGDTVNPRASLTWSLRDDVRLIASYGSAFRAPTFGELYNINNPSIVGNPDLDPEEITTYEIGVRGEYQRDLSYGVTYFENKIEDLIAPETTSTAVSQSGNVGKLKVKGVELEASQRFSDGSVLSGNYTYQYPLNEITDERLADVPLHRANVSFNYFISKHLSFFIAGLYKGESSRVSGDDRSDVDDYVTIDLALISQGLLIPELDIKASVYNLFDKEYEDPSPNVMVSDYPQNDVNMMLEATYRLQ